MQILYLDDYINYYNDKFSSIEVITPYKGTLHNGRVIDKDKFYKRIDKYFKLKNINNSIFGEKIIVIINNFYSTIDKLILKSILEELNYKEVTFINELELIKIKKDMLFINYNNSYFSINYLDNKNKIVSDIYQNNYVNNKLMKSIINILNKKYIFITGKNIKCLFCKLEKYNYYYFKNYDNLYIEILLNKLVNCQSLSTTKK